MAQLVLTSDTLAGTPATGTLEYNGQFFGTDSAAARAQMQRITLSTAVASTSGTSIDFTSIPAWVKRITVMFNGVSLSGTSNYLVQLGAGSVTTSGYSSAGGVYVAGTTVILTSTAGFVMRNNAAASNVISAIMNIVLVSSNNWLSTHTFGDVPSAATGSGGGNIALGGTLDRVRITTVNGTDTFDAGSVNILYEG